MFFLLFYKKNFWKKLDEKSRNMRIFIAGAAWYIILHSYLNSKYIGSNSIFYNCTKYLYILLLLDLSVVGVLFFGFNKNKKKKRGKKVMQRQIRQKFELNPKPRMEFKPVPKIINKLKEEHIPLYVSKSEDLPIYQSKKIPLDAISESKKLVSEVISESP